MSAHATDKTLTSSFLAPAVTRRVRMLQTTVPVLVLVTCCLSEDQVTRFQYDHPSNYIEPQDIGAPRSPTEVPHYFGNMPRSEAPVRVYSAGYRVEQEFHTPERSYGFGVEEKRVLERSNVPRQDHVPIVVKRPFEGRIEISPLTGRVVNYGSVPVPASAWTAISSTPHHGSD